MIAIRSKVAQRLLRYYFNDEDKKEYVNELARILQADPGNLDRKLKQFEAEGLFVSEFMGKQKYYYLNKDFVLLDVYRAYVKAALSLESQLKALFESKEGVDHLYIFGSYVEGNMDSFSDIDLLVVGDAAIIEMQRELKDLSKQVGRIINPVYMDNAEFQRRQNERDPFVLNILKGNHEKVI